MDEFVLNPMGENDSKKKRKNDKIKKMFFSSCIL